MVFVQGFGGKTAMWNWRTRVSRITPERVTWHVSVT